MKINKNFLDLEASYLFSTVNKKTRDFIAAHPEEMLLSFQSAMLQNRFVLQLLRQCIRQ